MREPSVEEIKIDIESKKTADKKKLKFLAKLAISGVIIRLLIYALPYHLSGLVIELLWLPLLLLLLALPFYGFEKLLDRVKKD